MATIFEVPSSTESTEVDVGPDSFKAPQSDVLVQGFES